MKALCLLQPWATLMAIGAKRIETRSWETLYRGPLVIVASKRYTRAQRDLCDTIYFQPALAAYQVPTSFGGRSFELPVGQALCVVTVRDCRRIDARGCLARWAAPHWRRECAFGDFTPGRFAWLTANVKRFQPFPVQGRLGLFDIDDRLVAEALNDTNRQGAESAKVTESPKT